MKHLKNKYFCTLTPKSSKSDVARKPKLLIGDKPTILKPSNLNPTGTDTINRNITHTVSRHLLTT